MAKGWWLSRAMAAGSLYGLGAVALACGARTGLDVPTASACVDLEATAAPAELDVFIMADASRSMTFLTADGTSKWTALRGALAQFVQDPASSGIGAAIAFFPIIDPTVPETCDLGSDACGAGNTCRPSRVCYPSGQLACTDDSDCANTGDPEDHCVQFGACALDASPCVVAPGVGCAQPGEACVPNGSCDDHYTCTPSSYRAPATMMRDLPAAAPGILAAVDAKTPDGATPTLPALAGAIDGAARWSTDHPGHKSIVILATDGLPTVCDPNIVDGKPETGLPALEGVAHAGLARGVQTFLIGVFAPEEAGDAQANLDGLALAGGTDHALIVTTDEHVSAELVHALDSVRSAAKACEFAIPEVGGATLDLEHLVVRVGAADVARRDGVGACDPVDGGFFYDRDVHATPPPSLVVLCPATCAELATDAPSIQLRVSCE